MCCMSGREFEFGLAMRSSGPPSNKDEEDSHIPSDPPLGKTSEGNGYVPEVY